MHPTSKDARIAGALYLLLGLTAPFSLIYVPNALFVRGNATATAQNVLASEMLFRTAIAVDLICTVLFIFVVMALYRLLSRVSKGQAALMVILALLSVPIAFLTVLNEIAALLLFRGGEFLTVFDKPQLDALGMLFLRLHGQGIVINEIFWGLWLFPLAVLVIRSGFLPRILGVLLIANGVTYLVVSLTSLLLPAYASVVDRYAFIPETGELWFMLWLLIKGIKVQPSAAAAPERSVAA